MNKPKPNKQVFRIGSVHCVPAAEYEHMKIYAEYLERRLEKYTSSKTRAKPVNWDGKTWPSLTALAENCRTSAQSLRYYIKLKKPFAGSLISYVNGNTVVH
jgi:hypothetical protein